MPVCVISWLPGWNWCLVPCPGSGSNGRTGRGPRFKFFTKCAFIAGYPKGRCWCRWYPYSRWRNHLVKPGGFGLPCLLGSVILRMLLLCALSRHLWTPTETTFVTGRQSLKYSWIGATGPCPYCHKHVFLSFVTMRADMAQILGLCRSPIIILCIFATPNPYCMFILKDTQRA